VIGKSVTRLTHLEFSIARNNHNAMESPATIAKWDGRRPIRKRCSR
jgi:hypothetical protein